MNKILTISSTIFVAMGMLFLIIGLLDGNVMSMARSGTIGTGFLVFASFFINVTKKLVY